MDFPKVYFSFSWRINRLRFFLYSLLIGIIISFINYILDMLLGDTGLGAFIIQTFIALLYGYFYFALMFKRFHDMNQKWLYIIPIYIAIIVVSILVSLYPTAQFLSYILYLALLIGLLVGLTLLFTKWTVWPNKYGPDPLEKKK